MSTALRISLLVGILVYIIAILSFLRKKKLNLKYSLLWLLSAAVLLIMDIFPVTVNRLAKFLGFAMTVNAVFLVFIFFILLILISLTSIVSRQQERIKTLTQETALLTKRVSDLEKAVGGENNDKNG